MRNILLFSGIIGYALAAAALMFALRLVGSMIATPVSATSPIFATIFGVTLLHEHVNRAQFAGIVTVVLGAITVLA